MDVSKQKIELVKWMVPNMMFETMILQSIDPLVQSIRIPRASNQFGISSAHWVWQDVGMVHIL
jgi:hypothetical protein